MEQDFARPTLIDQSIYIKFSNKCKTDRQEIRTILEQLCQLYIKKGKKVFEG